MSRTLQVPGAVRSLWTPRQRGALVVAEPEPGPILSNVEMLPVTEEVGGFTAEIITQRGRHTASKVCALRDQISGVYDVGDAYVEVVVSPDHSRTALVTVRFPRRDGRHPLDAPVIWKPSLDPVTGWMDYGRAMDMSMVQVRLFDREEGMRPVWISGATGSGKTTFEHVLIGELARRGLVWPIIIDMKGGGSLADWKGKVPHYVGATPEEPDTMAEVKRVLYGWRRMRSYRSLALADMPRMVDGENMGAALVWPIDDAHPIPMLVIEEAPVLWDAMPEAVEIVEKTSTLGRSLMMMLVLVSQATLVGSNVTGHRGAFGGSSTLRAQLQHYGLCAIFRNTAEAGRHAGEAASALGGVNPALLPEISGSSFAVAKQGGSRGMMCRGVWEQYPARMVRAARIPDLDAGSLAAFQQGMADAEEDDKPGATLIAMPGLVPMRSAPKVTEEVVLAAVADLELSGSVAWARADLLAAVREQLPGASEDSFDRVLRAMRSPGGALVQPEPRGVYMRRGVEGVS